MMHLRPWRYHIKTMIKSHTYSPLAENISSESAGTFIYNANKPIDVSKNSVSKILMHGSKAIFFASQSILSGLQRIMHSASAIFNTLNPSHEAEMLRLFTGVSLYETVASCFLTAVSYYEAAVARYPTQVSKHETRATCNETRAKCYEAHATCYDARAS